SDDWQVLSAAAWFAGFYAQWELAPQLVGLLKHNHWAVRRSAAESLGRLEYAPAGKALREVIDGEHDTHALADELHALVRLRHRDAARLCQRYLVHDDPFVRAEARR